MPFGEFLNNFPSGLFIAVHILLFFFGVWITMKASRIQLPYAQAFWLYPVVHLGFLAYLTGIFDIKMSVFLEQILMFVMMLWIITKAQGVKRT